MKSTTSIIFLTAAVAASASSDMVDMIQNTAPLFVTSLQEDTSGLLQDGLHDTTWGQSTSQDSASDDGYSMDKSLDILRAVPFFPSTRLNSDNNTFPEEEQSTPTMTETSDDTLLVGYSDHISDEEVVNRPDETEDESSFTKVESDEDVDGGEEQEDYIGEEEEEDDDEDEMNEAEEYADIDEADGNDDDDVNADVVSASRPKTWTPSRIQSPPTSTPSSAPTMSSSPPAPAPLNSYKSVRAPTSLWPKSVARASPTSSAVVA